MGRRAKERYLDGTALTSRVSAHGYRGQIKSVQRGTITFTGTSSTATLSPAVDPNNSVLRHTGQIPNGGALQDGQTYGRLSFTSGTVITATVGISPGGGTVSVGWEVIEYYPGVIKQVQRGTIALAGSSSATAAVSPAVNTAKSQLHFLGFSTDYTANTTVTQTMLTLTSGSLITANSPGTGTNQTAGYQVVEFY